MGDEPTKSSPWPIVAAVGIAATEAGVLFGVVPVAVGGVLAFGSSVAGMAREVGYATDRWRPLRLVGAAIAVVAAAAWLGVAPSPTPGGLADAARTDGIAVRAAIVFGSAVLLVAVGAVGPLVAGSAGGDRGR
ncbi:MULTISPECIES: DUF7541 family protein [Saliphagus]|uniref:Cox cluster protein n=1 Tax=Saliphagus infecundisoli TaxID=1849069 RepID=A0ABD5QA85_9EURY|nr:MULTISPECIES: cox cluster protein [Saliphagus]